MAVKDRAATTIGYCVNYDSDCYENGKLKAVSKDDEIRNAFIYVARDKPISVSTASDEFTQNMCGQEFFNKYKK